MTSENQFIIPFESAFACHQDPCADQNFKVTRGLTIPTNDEWDKWLHIEQPELLSLDFFGHAVHAKFSLKVVWTCECSASTKAMGEEGGKMRVCTGRGRKDMQKRSRTVMLGNIPWCMYLLGAWFKKKSVPKENNEIFMLYWPKPWCCSRAWEQHPSLERHQQSQVAISAFVARDKMVSERKKMKCLWQENNVPEATPLNTERQKDRTLFILLLFYLFLGAFYHPIFYLVLISFSSWNIVLYSKKSYNCGG